MNVKDFIESNPVATVDNKPIDVVELGELVSERTENAKVWSLGGNKRQAKVFSAPIHFRDIDGKFKSIDAKVKRKMIDAKLFSKYEYEDTAGNYHAQFNKDKPWNYRFVVGDKWIEYEALFEESDSVKIEVETSHVGVKETITLIDDKAPTVFEWRFTSNGLMPNPAVAWDANSNPVFVNESIVGDTIRYEVDTKDAVYPITVDPTTSVKATNDGYVINEGNANVSYTTVRNSTSGTLQSIPWFIGQRYELYEAQNYYRVDRSFGSFAIPNMTTLTAASLFLEGYSDYSTIDFEIYIHTSTYSTPKVVGDFDVFNGWQASGAYNGTVLNNAWNSSSYSAAWNEIVFNAAGRTAILAKKNNTFKMAAISKEDYNNSAPTGPEMVQFEHHGVTGKEPYLSITYTAPQNIVEALSALIEVEVAIPAKLKSVISALIEVEATIPAKLKSVVSALIEVETGITETKSLIRAVSALIEMEASITAVKSRIEAVLALIGVETEIGATWNAIATVSALVEVEVALTETKTLIRGVSALVEMEVLIPSNIKSIASALIEVEASITETKSLIREVSALIEVETNILNNIESPVSALIEVEASMAEIKSLIREVSALIEMEADITETWFLFIEQIKLLSAITKSIAKNSVIIDAIEKSSTIRELINKRSSITKTVDESSPMSILIDKRSVITKKKDKNSPVTILVDKESLI